VEGWPIVRDPGSVADELTEQIPALGWVMVSFAGIAVLAIVFVARWLPETKGLSVEEAVSVFERQAEGGTA
jgi:hypothetical protein